VWGQTYVFFVPLVVPFVILGVPILDTAFAIIRRTVRRTGVSVRDLEHLHHRLMRLGHGHRRAVVVLWTWTFLLSALVLYGVFNRSWSGAIPIGLLVLAVGLYTLFQPGLRAEPAAAVEAETIRPGVPAVGPEETQVASTMGASAPLAASVGSGSASDGGAAGGLGEVPPGAHRAQHRRRFARHDPPTRG
jgi:UDP-GlcNAc:undecaprenyl-phosphate GlcNAc-1-phosphate transferase